MSASSETQVSTASVAEDLEKRASELLQMAHEAGATGAEVYGYGGTSLSAKVEKGDLGQVQADEGSTLGLRVLIDGRLGFASTNQMRPEALRAAAVDAVAIAKLSPPDEANVLPEPDEVDDSHRMRHHLDPALAGIDVAQVVARAQALSQTAVDHDARVSVDQASFSVVSGASVVVSSRGIRQSDEDAALTMSLMGLAVDGAETGGFDYRGAVVRNSSQVEAELQRIAREVARACIGNLGATAGKTYKGPVAFAPAAFASSFLSPLLGSISAIAVQRGRSALADKIGEKIAPGLTLIDDPTDPKVAGARAFDREGLPARKIHLVDDGVLRTFIHNTYSAAVGKTKSTGHAQGGPRSVPGLGCHAIRIESSLADGLADEAEMLAALGTGLYIQRFSGSVDAASGDFSGTAKSARWVENGVVVRSVNEVMLSGNAFKLLNGSTQLTRATERVGGSSQIPWALVDGVSVTAG
ncbi:peptidase PmbA [Planctomycetes bacterium Poly30]|uniref:Peptidase PmbA n=1 Tax=Saltatorellus ferox TaxID=2528018 RepID=A0A518ET64_9BACT|nr:peptidase PmbA [Planctomycetes bacterium Poly30]